MFRPGFRAKILALLGLPLIVQVLCSSELIRVIQSETRRFEEQMRYEQIRAADAVFDEELGTAVTFSTVRSMGSMPALKEMGPSMRERLNKSFDDCKQLCNSKKQLKRLDRLKIESVASLDALVVTEPGGIDTVINDRPVRRNPYGSTPRSPEEEKALYDAWIDTNETTGKEELTLFKKLHINPGLMFTTFFELQELEKVEKQNATPILVLLLCNSLAPLVFMLLMRINLTRRLNKIREDTIGFALNKELTRPLSGTDEIAEFDQTLHIVGNEMLAVQEFRRQLVAVVGHDLKSPITSIQGTLTLLLEGVYGPLDERAVERIKEAVNQTQRLKILISNLLELEKIQNSSEDWQIQPFNVSEMILDTITGAEQTVEEKSVSITAQAENLDHVSERDALSQALGQLLSNAVTSAPSGSEVTIRAEKVGNWLELSVLNSGEKIPAELSQTLFSPFVSAVVPGQVPEAWGPGLGLAVAKSIVEKLEGKIGYDFNAGNVRFWMRIPPGARMKP